MGFRIHRGIFQKLNDARTAYENTFKIDTDGRIKEVDSEGNVTAGYLKVGEQATDADTVDGLHSGSFIRSDASDNVSGHTEWQDNYQIRLGAGADLRIWHDGNNHVFRSYHHGANYYFQLEDNEGTNKNGIIIQGDTSRSYVRLYEDGSERFRTKSTGVEVYGNIRVSNGITSTSSGGYGIIRGYDNDNHFIVIRGSVGTGTSTLSITGAHRTTFVEHANEANEGWYFLSKASGNYTEMARIDGVGQMYIRGNKVWHAGNDGSGSGLDADTVDGYHAIPYNSGSFVVGGDAETYYPVIIRKSSRTTGKITFYRDNVHQDENSRGSGRLVLTGFTSGWGHVPLTLHYETKGAGGTLWKFIGGNYRTNYMVVYLKGATTYYYKEEHGFEVNNHNPNGEPISDGRTTWNPVASSGGQPTWEGETPSINTIDGGTLYHDADIKAKHFLGDGRHLTNVDAQTLDGIDSTTITNSIATKLSLSGGTMTGGLTTNSTITSTKNGTAFVMDGGSSAEGVRMQADTDRTYPVFLRSINPGSGGETSAWIFKENNTAWGIWHNNPINALDFTRSPASGIANDVGGGDNTVMIRLDMAYGHGRFAGNVYSDGGNSTNWNTAYSWGNHASAGYLTSVPSEYLTQTEGDARYLQSLPSHNHDSLYHKLDFDAVTSAGRPDNESGTWTKSASTTNWGSYKVGTDADGGRAYNDAPGWIQYNVPSGYHTAYIGQLKWSSGGYFDVHAVKSDGSLVHRGRYLSKQSIENTSHGGDHDGQQIIKISGLDGMTAVRITNLVGRVHLQGIGWTKEIDTDGTQDSTTHWDLVNGKPSTFTPSSHTHSYNDLTNLPTIPSNNNQLTNGAGYITDLPDAGIGAGTYGSTSNQTKIDTITVDAKGRVTAVATGTGGDITTVRLVDDSGAYVQDTGGTAVLTIAGGAGITTSASGTTITITNSEAGEADAVRTELDARITANSTDIARNATDIATKAAAGGSYGQDFTADDMRVDQWFRNTVSGKGLYNDATANHWYSDSSSRWRIRSGSSTEAWLLMGTSNNATRGSFYANSSNHVGILDANNEWAVKVVHDSHVELRDNNETVFTAGQGGHSSNYGTVCTHGGGRGGWEGYSINGRFVFMSADSSNSGIYNDTDNEWMTRWHRNGATELYHNGSKKLETTSSGATVTGTMTATAFSGDGSALTGISAGAPPVTTTAEGGEPSTLRSIHFSPGEGAATFTLADGSTYRLAFAR